MTTDITIPAYTRYHWAKSDRGNPQQIHLLEHHLADVGACFEALLSQPTIRRRLAGSAGKDDLDPATTARLCVLAALHDIGKANMGFQTQIWSAEYLPGGRRPASFPGVGHTRDMVPVLDNDGDTETADWFFSALGFEQGVLQWDNGILQWDDNDGMTACGLFVATLSHHGAPLNLQDTLSTNSRAWQRFCQPETPRVRRKSWKAGPSMVPGRLYRRRAVPALRCRLPAPLSGPLHPGRLDWLQRNMVQVCECAG